MVRIFAIFLFAFLSSSLAAQDVDPFLDANAIVIHARLKAISRTDVPQPWYDGDRIEVSNSCGYDTAILEVKKVLLGEYKKKELSAHLTLGEWCKSILQVNVQDYVLYLKWNGDVWKIDQELSSPLVRVGRTLWIVQPSLLASLEIKNQLAAQVVRLPESILADLAAGQAESMGLGPGETASHAEQIHALKSMRPSDWTGNLLHFRKGISLEAYGKLLAPKHRVSK